MAVSWLTRLVAGLSLRKAQVRARISPQEIYGGQCSTGLVSPSPSLFPYHRSSPYIHIISSMNNSAVGGNSSQPTEMNNYYNNVWDISSHGGEYEVKNCLLGRDDGGSTYLWNVGRQLLYTAVHPRRQFWTLLQQPWLKGATRLSAEIQPYICAVFRLTIL
jgi:hypothetical protein